MQAHSIKSCGFESAHLGGDAVLDELDEDAELRDKKGRHMRGTAFYFFVLSSVTYLSKLRFFMFLLVFGANRAQLPVSCVVRPYHSADIACFNILVIVLQYDIHFPFFIVFVYKNTIAYPPE